MHEVLPSINCSDFACVAQRLHTIQSFLAHDRFVHLDIADGSFTFNKLWNDPLKWQELQAPYRLEVHLMVHEPEKIFLSWLKAGAKRVVLHYETLFDPKLRFHPVDAKALLRELSLVAAHHQASIMLAVNPETPVEHLLEAKDIVSDFQILSVHPGLPGQNFLEFSLEKISFLRQRFPDAIIEVDGGVSLETSPRILQAGANALVAAHSIFDSADPAVAYRKLLSL